MIHIKKDGRIPIVILADRDVYFKENDNIHNPCLAQHAAFVVKASDGDVQWLRPHINVLKCFVYYCISEYRHEPAGLYHWIINSAIGVDNDPQCGNTESPDEGACISYENNC